MPRNQGAASDQVRKATPSGSPYEARLLARITQGDMRAFEELYRIYHPQLTRFLGGMIRRPHLVEEAVNDTLMVVWSRAGAYNGLSKVSTWIFAIGYRKALKALKRMDEPMEDKFAETRPSLEAGPEQRMGEVQVRGELLKAMAGLSADHRAVVNLTYFHEIGYREIADIMDCPVDTVKTRMFHARRHLKTKLGGGLADWL